MSRPAPFVARYWRLLDALSTRYHCRPSDLILGGWGAFNWDVAVLMQVQADEEFQETQRQLAELRKRGRGID